MTHWTTDKSQVEKFTTTVGREGYTLDEALQALGVKAITDLRSSLGNALTELQKVKKGVRAKSALAVLPLDEQRALYQNDELAKFGQMIRSFAPWANNEKHPVTDVEIALIVQRGAKSGLDVLNPHEVQVWKDKRGNINFQIAHALTAQWANVTLGGHTQPRYCELTDDEKESHGIPTTDHAIRCELVMLADISLIKTMIDAGWEPQEARTDVTMIGVGVVSASDWDGAYFAPNARSKRWKLEKRAYADAIRGRYGTPSEKDILELRRVRGEDSIEPGDWAVAQDEISTETAVRHAKVSANGNGHETPTETPEETLARNRAIMHGAPEDDFIDGIVEDVADGEVVDIDQVAKAADEDFGDDGTTPEQRASMDHKTPKGKRLNDCTPDELSAMLDWCNDDPKADTVAGKMLKGHIEVVLDYMKQFEVSDE